MKSLLMRTILISLMTFAAVGCGSSSGQRDGSQFQHDHAAKLFLEAMKTRESDQCQALELLTQSIEARPSYNAHYHRAWIYALQGHDDNAKADVAAGLELEPENKELQWLDGELKKPADQRQLDAPPTSAK